MQPNRSFALSDFLVQAFGVKHAISSFEGIQFDYKTCVPYMRVKWEMHDDIELEPVEHLKRELGSMFDVLVEEMQSAEK